MTNRRMWLIDAGYLFNARHSVYQNYQFSYLKLRQKIEQDGELWRAYYLNSAFTSTSTDAQEAFHNWLATPMPQGPGFVTKLYGLKNQRGDSAYCNTCKTKVRLRCPNQKPDDPTHFLTNEVQKGVDVGIATTALIHKDSFDTLVLSSGDGDLLDAVEHLLEIGKRFELVVFDQAVSTDLYNRAEKIYYIDRFADEVSS